MLCGRGRAVSRTPMAASSGLLIVVALLAGLLSGLVHPASAQANATASCGVETKPRPEDTRQINLVIDDSLSMFLNTQTGELLDRWSFAKYSLEVFAALMGPADTLNVYRLSDTKKTDRLTLRGDRSALERVAEIHAMEMGGKRTPYAPVQWAAEDLVDSPAKKKWLVVLTDGQFDDLAPGTFQRDVREFADLNIEVAVLALEDQAEVIASDPEAGIFFEKADTVEQVLDKMTTLADLIYPRVKAPIADGARVWATDVPMKDLVIFAQGDEVNVNRVDAGRVTVQPSTSVAVRWAENPSVSVRGVGEVRDPKPNRALVGQVATFNDVPKGDLTFQVGSPKTLDIFYRPDVKFGVQLISASGERVAPDAAIEGDTYEVQYGFMDDECRIVTSELLGDVKYSGNITRNGKKVKDNFLPGAKFEFEAGAVTLNVSATYLGGEASDKLPMSVRDFEGTSVVSPSGTAQRYLVSELEQFPGASSGVEFTYTIKDRNLAEEVNRAPTPEEWARLNPDDITVTSDANLDWRAIKGEPGVILVVPRAPSGDIYAATVGQVTFTVTAPPIVGPENLSAGADIEIVDDLSWLDRFWNWFWTVGIWLLLLLLLLIVILGYVFKRRFSRKIASSPSIKSIPITVGKTPQTARGRFTKNRIRWLLPFVADTATLVYVPTGAYGFPPLKVKAGAGKSVQVTNWKQLAQQMEQGKAQGRSLTVGSNMIDGNTKRMPSLGPNGVIRARSTATGYDYQLIPTQT
jgi:hypothetical protein